MKRIVILIIFASLAIAVSAAFSIERHDAKGIYELNVLAVEDPIYPTCTMGCQYVGGWDLCVMCFDCDMLFENIGHGDRATCTGLGDPGGPE